MSCGWRSAPSRATLCWSRLVSPVSGRSCFGVSRRESGHRRVPEPPAITIANIGLRLPELLPVDLGLEALPQLERAPIGRPDRVGEDGPDATLLELVDGSRARATGRRDGVAQLCGMQVG